MATSRKATPPQLLTSRLFYGCYANVAVVSLRFEPSGVEGDAWASPPALRDSSFSFRLWSEFDAPRGRFREHLEAEAGELKSFSAAQSARFSSLRALICLAKVCFLLRLQINFPESAVRSNLIDPI